MASVDQGATRPRGERAARQRSVLGAVVRPAFHTLRAAVVVGADWLLDRVTAPFRAAQMLYRVAQFRASYRSRPSPLTRLAKLAVIVAPVAAVAIALLSGRDKPAAAPTFQPQANATQAHHRSSALRPKKFRTRPATPLVAKPVRHVRSRPASHPAPRREAVSSSQPSRRYSAPVHATPRPTRTWKTSHRHHEASPPPAPAPDDRRRGATPPATPPPDDRRRGAKPPATPPPDDRRRGAKPPPSAPAQGP